MQLDVRIDKKPDGKTVVSLPVDPAISADFPRMLYVCFCRASWEATKGSRGATSSESAKIRMHLKGGFGPYF